jgi:hypothetical protein
MKTFYPALLLVLVALVSCEYEPSGEFSRNIPGPGEATPIWIDLAAENDTIYTHPAGDLRFMLYTGEKKIHGFEVCVNDKCEIIPYYHDSFNIGIFDVRPGNYSLTVNIYTDTGSGSMAEGFGVEAFLYSKKFTLVVLEWSSPWSGKLSVKPEQGSLKISWDRYYGANFQAYILTKKTDWSSRHMATFTNLASTTFYDSSYVGENASYMVELVTKDDRLTTNAVVYKGTLPKLHIKEVKNNLLTLEWDRSPYFKNIEKYAIYNSRWDYELLAEITDLNVTSVVLDNLRFLDEYEFLFVPIPKYFVEYFLQDIRHQENYLGSKAHGLIGEKFSKGTIVTALGDYFYYPAGDYIFEYNYVEDRATRTIQLTSPHSEFAVSANRKFVLAADNRRSVLLYDYNRSKTYSLDQFADGFNQVSYPAISDNGIGIMRLYNFSSANNVDGSILVYDFVNERIIYQGPLGQGMTTSLRISADGKYICRNLNTVYQVQNNSILYLREVSNLIAGSSHFEFHPADPELFIYRKQANLYCRNIMDLSTAFSCQINPNSFLHNIDFNANKFLAYSEDRLRLYDMNTCEEIWSYPAKWVVTGVRFCYNAVYYSGLGVRLKIGPE